jgi:hypothetical protein
MKCSNCHAECPEYANKCDFCGFQFFETTPQVASSVSASESSAPPPVPPSVTSDNPYASSNNATYEDSSLLMHSEIQNHLPLSITAAVMSLCCCCIPFGIIPVILSTQVNSKLARGDYVGAQRDSDSAKLWSWISIGIALVFFVLNLIIRMVGFAAEGQSF